MKKIEVLTITKSDIRVCISVVLKNESLEQINSDSLQRYCKYKIQCMTSHVLFSPTWFESDKDPGRKQKVTTDDGSTPQRERKKKRREMHCSSGSFTDDGEKCVCLRLVIIIKIFSWYVVLKN